jgi:hypothetical protein
MLRRRPVGGLAPGLLPWHWLVYENDEQDRHNGVAMIITIMILIDTIMFFTMSNTQRGAMIIADNV